MFKTGRYIRHNYTIVELLMVILIMAILMGISAAGLTMFIKQQGAAGGVRVIGNQLNLARSYAVSKNRYVAVLFPDNAAVTKNFDLKYLFRKTLLCFVKQNASAGYDYDEWIEGAEWYEQADGTLTKITSLPPQIAKMVKINPADTATNREVPAVVYSPNGTLVAGAEVKISVMRAHYDVENDKIVYDSKDKDGKGWTITINPFTGRMSYAKEN